MENRGIEPLTPDCKTGIMPLVLIPHNYCNLAPSSPDALQGLRLNAEDEAWLSQNVSAGPFVEYGIPTHQVVALRNQPKLLKDSLDAVIWG